MTAPTRPATYQEALAAAEAASAARTAPKNDPAAAVAATSEQIIGARDNASVWAKSAIHRLWLTVNPYDDSQVREFTTKAAGLLGSAQTAAARVAAAGQSQQLAALGIRVTGTPSNPIDVRAPGVKIKNGQLQLHRRTVTVDYAAADGVKVSAADMSTQSILERPAALFRYVQSQGGLDAASQASQRIDSLIDDNLMLAQRLAQQQVLAQAVNLDAGGNHRGRNGAKITGYRRVIHPELSRGGTCGMCIAASDRIYKVAELLPIHAHCKCTIAAVTDEYDPADDLNAVDLNQLYKQAGGTSVAHLKRTRYKVDEHGELGPVLVPDKKYKPRTTKSKVRAGNTGVSDGKPESKTDVAARHLPLLKQSLADLRARGLAEDSPQITYHKDTIDRLRSELKASGGGEGRQPSSKPAKSAERETKARDAGGGNRPPTKPPTGGQSVQGADDPKERLNRIFADQTTAATPKQRAAVARWQGKDRFYEKVQRALSGAGEPEAVAIAQELSNLARPLPEDVEVWRGIRSTARAFGVDDVNALKGREWIESRFTATTTSRDTATPEFTRPGAKPAILQITARAGASAVWLPPLGVDENAGQNELLFTQGAVVRILSVDDSGEIPVISVEVT
jgi:hypothetical protein